MSVTTTKTGPLTIFLILSFTWALVGAGELLAAVPGTSPNKDLSDIPSTEEVVVMGVAVAAVIAIIVVAIVNSGNDEENGEAEEVTLLEIDEHTPRVRVDPVLTLGRDTLGAGLAFSF